jgi:hypothetical protein
MLKGILMLRGILSSRKQIKFSPAGPLGLSAPTVSGILIIVALAVVAFFLYRRR